MFRRLTLDGVVLPPDPKAPPAMQALISASGRREALEPILRETAEQFGCDHFEYVLMSRPAPESRQNQPRVLGFSTVANDDWLTRWEQQNYRLVDPRVQHTMDTLLPAYPDTWSCSALQASTDDPLTHAFCADAVAVGVGSGLFFQVPDARVQGALVCWTMADPNPSPARLSRLSSRLGDLMVLGYYFHMQVIRKVVDTALATYEVVANPGHGPVAGTKTKRHGSMPPDTVRLTDRQLECLQLSSAGLYVDEIADKIGIRPTTVRLHLQSARQKLGVERTNEAISEGFRQGLLK